jgi:hypothetical protein
MDQPTAEQALHQLGPLVGEWKFEARWPDGALWPGGGGITFEWHASGAHLLQHGEARARAVRLIATSRGACHRTVAHAGTGERVS